MGVSPSCPSLLTPGGSGFVVFWLIDMACYVGSFTGVYLGRRHQPASDDIPEMEIFDFILDCYVSEVGQVFDCQSIEKQSPNFSQYVVTSDDEQSRILAGLVKGQLYTLRLAVTAKVTGKNSAKPKFRVMDVLDVPTMAAA